MNNKPVKKTCPSCDGDGGYYPSPQYRPFDFRRCSTCGGKGTVNDGDKKEPDTPENRFRDAIKNSNFF